MWICTLSSPLLTPGTLVTFTSKTPREVKVQLDLEQKDTSWSTTGSSSVHVLNSKGTQNGHVGALLAFSVSCQV